MADDVRSACLFRPVNAADLDEVMRIEHIAYDFPWTRGNFVDSLASGHWAQGLWERASGLLLGYGWASLGAAEVHLLNLTIAPWAQGRGYARYLLDQLVEWSCAAGAEQLWLEVRPTNARAIALYQRYGMDIVGQRPRYYPAAHGLREDAWVMGLRLV